jgi:hypothetical protein
MENHTQRSRPTLHSALQAGCVRWAPILGAPAAPAQKPDGAGKAARDPVAAEPRHIVEMQEE